MGRREHKIGKDIRILEQKYRRRPASEPVEDLLFSEVCDTLGNWTLSGDISAVVDYGFYQEGSESMKFYSESIAYGIAYRTIPNIGSYIGFWARVKWDPDAGYYRAYYDIYQEDDPWDYLTFFVYEDLSTHETRWKIYIGVGDDTLNSESALFPQETWVWIEWYRSASEIRMYMDGELKFSLDVSYLMTWDMFGVYHGHGGSALGEVWLDYLRIYANGDTPPD